MKTTTRSLTLRLKPENDGRVSLSLTGRVHGEKMHGRASLLAMASLWVRPEPLSVVLSADVSGSWCWAEDWMDALIDEVGGCEVRFVSRGGGHGRR